MFKGRPLVVFALALFQFALIPTSSAQEFSEVPLSTTGFRSASHSWGDYDADGDLDLLMGGEKSAGAGLLLLKNENGTLVETSFNITMGYSSATAWADYDGDGDLDFAIGGYNHPGTWPPAENRIYRNDGAAGFVPTAPEIDAAGIPIWGDFDRDGNLDLLILGVTYNDLANRFRLYQNRPGKPWRLVWEKVLPHNLGGTVIEDWDKDGWLDIVYAYLRFEGGWALVQLKNEGAFNFSAGESNFGTSTPYIAIMDDLDSDGDLDYAFTGEIWPQRILNVRQNLPDQWREFSVDTIGLGLAAADFDNDGKLDLITTDGPPPEGSGNYFRLYKNTTVTDLRFSPRDLSITGASFSSITAADYDADEDPDFVVSGFIGGIPTTRLFKNLAPRQNLPPTSPTNLEAEVGFNGSVTITWDPAADDEHQSSALTYNYWLRKAGSTQDLISSDSDRLTGRLHVPRRGNAGTALRAPFASLLAGEYEFAVQSIDLALSGSPFSEKISFTVSAGLPRLDDFLISELSFRHATISLEVIPNGSATEVWVEYGTNTIPELVTEPISLDASTTPSGLEFVLTNVATEFTYRARVVASNAVGVSTTPLADFKIANTPPSLATTSITTFPNTPSEPTQISFNDVETPRENLKLTFKIETNVGNPDLLKPEGILFEPNSSGGLLILVPVTGEHGFVNTTLTVQDEHGASVSRLIRLRIADFSLLDLANASLNAFFRMGDVDSDGWLDMLDGRLWFQNQLGTNISTAPMSHLLGFSGVNAIGDADNDNQLDLAVSGRDPSGAYVTQVFTYKIQPPTTVARFRPLQTPLTPGAIDSSAISWADFDLDGDLDLVGFGSTSATIESAYGKVWRNDGNFTFTPVEPLFPAAAKAAVAWTDLNLDGAADFIVNGQTNSRLVSTTVTTIFLNNLNGGYTNLPTNLPNLRQTSLVWGDLDNDGFPDLFMSGQDPESRTYRVLLFRNNADGTFTERFRVSGFLARNPHLVDIDNDGLLDLLYYADDNMFIYQFKLFLNKGAWNFEDISPDTDPLFLRSIPPVNVGDFNNDNRIDLAKVNLILKNNAFNTNHPPSAPANLRASITGDNVQLSWQAAQDEEQENGLTYNLRVGTAPGASDIVSPLAHPGGQLKSALHGNAYQSHTRILRSLEPGAYYWSVQAIDHSFSGGSFAPEQIFVIGSASPEFQTISINTDESILLNIQSPHVADYVLEFSLDLIEWAHLQTISLTQGSNPLLIPAAPEPARFFRLRK